MNVIVFSVVFVTAHLSTATTWDIYRDHLTLRMLHVSASLPSRFTRLCCLREIALPRRNRRGVAFPSAAVRLSTAVPLYVSAVKLDVCVLVQSRLSSDSVDLQSVRKILTVNKLRLKGWHAPLSLDLGKI